MEGFVHVGTGALARPSRAQLGILLHCRYADIRTGCLKCRRTANAEPSASTLGISDQNQTSPVGTGAPALCSVTFVLRYVPNPAREGYNSLSESLSHRAHQERHEVHLHALCPQRHHSRFRREGRQCSHPGRHRHQRTRREKPPRTRADLRIRHTATQLALASEILARNLRPDTYPFTARSVISNPLSIIANASRNCASLMHSGGFV